MGGIATTVDLNGQFSKSAAGPVALESRIRKLAELGTSQSDQDKVALSLRQSAASDPNFEKKLTILEKYNFKIAQADSAEAGRPGMRMSASDWSGPENPNEMLLKVNPKDLNGGMNVLDEALKKIQPLEKQDMFRLLKEVTNPGYSGTTGEQRFEFYQASRDRLNSINSVLGQPPVPTPANEAKMREAVGLPPASAAAPTPAR